MISGATRLANRYAGTIRWVSFLLTVGGLLVLARRLPLGPMLALLEMRVAELGLWGPLVFGLVYVIAVVILMPSWLLTMTAGALFGLVAGTVVVSLASTIGAALAFLIARRLARDWIRRQLGQSPRLQAIDQAIREGGWKIVALLRLSPAVPFTLQNYFYGLTGLSFGTCILTSWLTMLPGTFLYVYLGHVSRLGLEAAAGEEHGRSPAEWAVLVVGLLATLGVIVYVSRLAWRLLRQRVAIPDAAPLPDMIHDDKEPEAWPWGTSACALVALAALALAGWACLDPEAFQHRVSGFLSLPHPSRRVAEP